MKKNMNTMNINNAMYIAEVEEALVEANGSEEFPVKPSKRAERRKLTANHKNADHRKAEALGMNSPWKEPTHSKWVDPYLKHHISEGDWHNFHRRPDSSKRRREEGRRNIRNWREEYADGSIFVRSTYQWRYWENDVDFIYNLRMEEFDEEIWAEIWREYDEAKYWEKIEEEEWEEMSTSKEVDEYFS